VISLPQTKSAPGKTLLALTGWDRAVWEGEFRRHAPEREIAWTRAMPTDPDIRFAVVWKQPQGLLAGLPNLRAVFSAGAGVDHLLADPGLPAVPVIRMVDPDLTTRMSEYVVWQVLDHLRQGQRYRAQQGQKTWRELPQPAAGEVTVGILGVGVLGADAAAKLAALGFRVAGWSRTSKTIAGVSCWHGKSGLKPFLAASDIVVVLLPLTAETRGILDRGFFAGMKRDTPLGGPVLINAGRGGLQVDADIADALDSGVLMATSLDVFQTEPLAAASPLWRHPRVTVTPHAAASSSPKSLVPAILRQMAAIEAGSIPENTVDRAAGY
jgi:glyoxylate/hydroxypyruvate reductase A